MTPLSPDGADTVPPQPPSRRSRRLLVLACLVAAIGAVGAWWWYSRTPPVIPPVPPDITDSEILQAIEGARTKVAAAPKSADAWGQLGMVFLAHVHDQEAEQCFAEAARLAPADPRWPYGRAVVHVKRDPDVAIRYLRQAAGGPPSETRSVARLQLAELLVDRRELDEAEKLFREERDNAPGNVRAVFGLGLVAVARGDEPVATDLFTLARQSRYARKRATAQLARLALARGDRDAAARLEKEAVPPPDPSWPDPFVEASRGLLAGRRARTEEASRLEQEGRFAEAAELFLNEVREHSTPRAYSGAGINLLRAGQVQEAVPLLREGVRLAPDDAQAHYYLALALFTWAEAQQQRSPGSKQVREAFAEVRDHARRATEVKPDHAQAYLFWGLSLKHLGEQKDSVEPLRKGVACRPEEFELQLALGEALLATGQQREAERHLENARQLDPKDPRPPQALERVRGKKP